MKTKFEYEKGAEICHRMQNRMRYINVTNKESRHFNKHKLVRFDGPIGFNSDLMFMARIGRQY